MESVFFSSLRNKSAGKCQLAKASLVSPDSQWTFQMGLYSVSEGVEFSYEMMQQTRGESFKTLNSSKMDKYDDEKQMH